MEAIDGDLEKSSNMTLALLSCVSLDTVPQSSHAERLLRIRRYCTSRLQIQHFEVIYQPRLTVSPCSIIKCSNRRVFALLRLMVAGFVDDQHYPVLSYLLRWLICKIVLLLPARTCPAMNGDRKTNDKNTNTEDILCQGETALDIITSY